MPFVYTEDYDEPIRAILNGLEEKGLRSTRDIHENMILAFENELFDAAEHSAKGLASPDGWRLAAEYARLAANEKIAELRLAAEEDYPRAREALVEVAQTALKLILSERNKLTYMPVPVPLLTAVDLLFQASVLRHRMWSQSQLLSVELLGQNFRITDAANTVVFDINSPPVLPQSESTFRSVLQSVSNILQDLDTTTSKSPEEVPYVSHETFIFGLDMATTKLMAYAE